MAVPKPYRAPPETDEPTPPPPEERGAEKYRDPYEKYGYQVGGGVTAYKYKGIAAPPPEKPAVVETVITKPGAAKIDIGIVAPPEVQAKVEKQTTYNIEKPDNSFVAALQAQYQADMIKNQAYLGATKSAFEKLEELGKQRITPKDRRGVLYARADVDKEKQPAWLKKWNKRAEEFIDKITSDKYSKTTTNLDKLGKQYADIVDAQTWQGFDEQRQYLQDIKKYDAEINEYNKTINSFNQEADRINAEAKNLPIDKIDAYNQKVADLISAADGVDTTSEKAVNSYNRKVDQLNKEGIKVDKYIDEVKSFSTKVDSFNRNIEAVKAPEQPKQPDTGVGSLTALAIYGTAEKFKEANAKGLSVSEKVKNTGALVGDLLVPGVWARHWNEMGDVEKAVNIGIDLLVLVPIAKIAVSGTRAALASTSKAAAEQLARTAIKQNIKLRNVKIKQIQKLYGRKSVSTLKQVTKAQDKFLESMMHNHNIEKLIAQKKNLLKTATDKKTAADFVISEGKKQIVNPELLAKSELVEKARLIQRGSAAQQRAITGLEKEISRLQKQLVSSRARTVKNELKLESAGKQFAKQAKATKVGGDIAPQIDKIPSDLVDNAKQYYAAITRERQNTAAIRQQLASVEKRLLAAQQSKPTQPSYWSDLLQDKLLLEGKLKYSKADDAVKVYNELLKTRADIDNIYNKRLALKLKGKHLKGKFKQAENKQLADLLGKEARLQREIDAIIKTLEIEASPSGFFGSGGTATATRTLPTTRVPKLTGSGTGVRSVISAEVAKAGVRAAEEVKGIPFAIDKGKVKGVTTPEIVKAAEIAPTEKIKEEEAGKPKPKPAGKEKVATTEATKPKVGEAEDIEPKPVPAPKPKPKPVPEPKVPPPKPPPAPTPKVTKHEPVKLRPKIKFRKDQSDKKKRALIKDSGGAFAWRMGEVGGKDVYDVFAYPYNKDTYTTVLGSAPKGATVINRGKGSAYSTAQVIKGLAPSKLVRVDRGIVDIHVMPVGKNRIKLKITGDPKLETRGDITIGGNGGRISEKSPRISGRMARISGRMPRLR